MRKFARRSRPALFWQDIARNWLLTNSISAGATLLAFEAPAAGTLSSLPPEDITILRIVGNFSVSLVTSGNWTLGLMVVDNGWTPALIGAAGFQTDADKRVLWHQTYDADNLSGVAGFASVLWMPPGMTLVNGTVDLFASAPRESVHLDVTPRIKLEAGKALVLVAWENTAGGTLTTLSYDMRVLFQRSQRR